MGDGVERVLRVGEGDDAVASGLEKESSHGQDLFIVVYTEDGLLGAHGFSVLPGCTGTGFRTGSKGAALTDWASSGASVGWQACGRAALCRPAVRADELGSGRSGTSSTGLAGS